MANFYKQQCKICNIDFKIYGGQYPEIHREICDICTEKEFNDDVLNKTLALLYKAVSQKNKEKIDRMTTEEKKRIAILAWEDGMVSWGKIQ